MKIQKEKTSIFKNIPLIMLWIGQGFSSMGSGIYSLAVAWEVIRVTGSTLIMGTVLLANMLPRLIFSLFGGAIGDRFPKRNILIIGDLSRGAVGFLWGISLIGRTPGLMELLIVSIFFGLAQAFFGPAYNAMIPEVIKRHQISRAVTINQLILKLSGLISPVIGGVLISQFSFGIVVLIDAITYGLAFLANLLLPKISIKKKKEATSIFADIRTGLQYFINHRIIFWGVILITFANLAVVSF